VVGIEKQPGVSNYFIGNDTAQWHTDVPHYGRIEYQGVYPGIDLVWYGSQRQFEYDFVVGPGADPKRIQVSYQGVESLRVEENGDLVLRTALGEMRQQKPQVYQEIAGHRVAVGAEYSITAGNRVSFALAQYDGKRELRIDPVVLAYSTFLGGNGPSSGPFLFGSGPEINSHGPDLGYGIAVDGTGAAYVTGQTSSTSFPTDSPYQATYPGGTYDAFVTKLTPAGNALVYSTYLGGSNLDHGSAIAVDGSGSAYITGWTQSSNFPTKSAFQGSNHGSGLPNAFVTKLAPAGNALVYSTYLGGSGTYWGDYGQGIAVDATGSAYITGLAHSQDFPTQSPFQETNAAPDNGSGFVTKLTPAGNALVYSTYLGGPATQELGCGDGGNAIAVDGAGYAYIAGQTCSGSFPLKSPFQPLNTEPESTPSAFVTKLMPAGNALAYSTYLGGSGGDVANGIAVDGSGSAYLTGYTRSTDFPTQSPYQASNLGAASGGQNAFVTKLTPAGNALVYSTYLGGSGTDEGYGLAIDSEGAAYITGSTTSTNFPTLSPYQAKLLGPGNAFVTKLMPAGNVLAYSTYLGGSGNFMGQYSNITIGDFGAGIAVDAAGAAYITGATDSANFPIQSPFQSTLQGVQNAFVAKLTVAAAVPELAISPLALTFSYTVGGASPAAQSVTVGNSGTGTLVWSAGSSASWLTVSPTSGTGAGTLTIGINPAGLSAQTYNGTIAVTDSAAANSPQTIAVTLAVAAPALNLPTIASVVNGASFQPGIESGSWVTIKGSNLAPDSRIWQASDFNGNNLPLALDGVSVTIDGKPAAVYYISPTQLNVQAPTDPVTGPVPVIVTNGQVSAAFSAQLQTYAPAFFLYSGTAYAIAQIYPGNALVGDPSQISGTVAAAPGDVLIFWTTGFGPTSPATPAGIVVSGAPAVQTLPVVTVGGTPVTVISAVLSPGSAGLYQVAIQLPASVPTGAVAIQASVGSIQSAAGVLIFVSKP
jgi:uncharacterized protein (TIGR03437 family)